jgi:hypothetical protein
LPDGLLALKDAGSHGVAAGLDADATAFEKVGHSCECLAAISAGGAYGEDEVSEGEVPFSGFKGLFHDV